MILKFSTSGLWNKCIRPKKDVSHQTKFQKLMRASNLYFFWKWVLNFGNNFLINGPILFHGLLKGDARDKEKHESFFDLISSWLVGYTCIVAFINAFFVRIIGLTLIIGWKHIAYGYWKENKTSAKL